MCFVLHIFVLVSEENSAGPISLMQEITPDYIEPSSEANNQSPQEQLIKAAKLGKQGAYVYSIKHLLVN